MLQNLTVVELRAKCKSKGLKGYSTKCKKDLVKLLQKKPMKGGGNFVPPQHFWTSVRIIADNILNRYFKFAFVIDQWNMSDSEIARGTTFNYLGHKYEVTNIEYTKETGFREKVVTAERL